MTRKKSHIPLLLLLLFLIQPGGFSQRFDGGILAGGVISQVDGDNWGGYSKAGFLAGGFVQLDLSPHLALQMEMEYIQKGSNKPAYYEQGDNHSYLMRLHYLEIPVLLQGTFLKRISVEAGPAADVLLGYSELQDGLEVPAEYPFRQVTLAGIAGVSGYITRHLKATLRFNYSLLSIRSFQDKPPSVWRKILLEVGQFNNVLSLSLSYQFKGRRSW